MANDAVSAPCVRLAVGVCEGPPKLVVRRLLQPVIQDPRLRFLCRESEQAVMLAELPLHRLDEVLADRTAAFNRKLKLYSHSLGASPLAW